METFSFNLSVLVNASVPNGTWIENSADLTYTEGYSSHMKSGTYFLVETEPIPREVNITIDELPEQIPANLTLRLSGNITILPDGTVRNAAVFFDDVLMGNATLLNETNVTRFSHLLSLPETLTEGNHTIIINVTLITGESSESRVMVQYTKEQPVQRIITIVPDPIVGDIEQGVTITISGNVTIELEGTIQSVRMFLDGSCVQDAILDNWTYRAFILLPPGLTEGNHTITVNVTLATGESAEKSLEFIFAPGPVTHTITISIDPVTGKIEPNSEIELSGRITVVPDAPIKEITIHFDGERVGSTAVANPTFSVTITLPDALIPGNHTIKITATLATGESEVKTETVTYEAEEDETGDGDGKGINGVLIGGGIVVVSVLVLLILFLRKKDASTETVGQEKDRSDLKKDERIHGKEIDKADAKPDGQETENPSKSLPRP